MMNTKKEIRNNEEITLPAITQSLFMAIIDTVKKEKIVIGLGSGKHLTIHFGTNSKVFDVHVKDEANKENPYTTLIKIPHDQLKMIMEEVELWLKNNQGNLSPMKINIGWLNRKGCVFMKLDVTDATSEKFIKSKGKRFKMIDKISHSTLSEILLYSEEVKVDTGISYLVCQIHKKGITLYGILFYPYKNYKPYFLSLNTLKKYGLELLQTLLRKINDLDIECNDDVKNLINKSLIQFKKT